MKSPVIALDPGPKQTAWCVYYTSPAQHVSAGISPNELMLAHLKGMDPAGVLAIEHMQSFGMAVGAEVFETCYWIGRFTQAWGKTVRRVYRKDVKLHHCQTVKANDSNIRAALIDRFGEPGTKKAPGLLYGLKKDMWSAFAIAVMTADQMTAESAPPKKGKVFVRVEERE